MSSADETNPLIASPSASPSEPRPDEFPIELEEVEAPQSIPKPPIKTNMVAQEVQVKVTGARLGEGEGEREQFTEETTSVLVSEKGGVVRLSAAVAPGQLLYLTNEESRREVVAQVKRKRTYKPTSCYVELEFAESAPRFWGREFSAAAALLPKNAQDAQAAALVISAEATDDEPGEPPPAPTAEEVQALKREVNALRERLKLTQSSAAGEEASAPAPVQASVQDAPPAPAMGDVPSAESNSNSGTNEAPAATFTVQSLPIEHNFDPTQSTPPKQARKPSRDFTVPRPKSKRSPRARGSFTPGFREGALRLVLLGTALVITAVGAAWYKHWIPWKSSANMPPLSAPGSALDAQTSTLPRGQEAAKAPSEFSNTKVVSDAPETSRGTPSLTAAPPNRPAPEAADSAESSVQASASSESAIRPAVTRTPASARPAAKRSTVPPKSKAVSDSVAASEADGVTVPPKLIKSVRPIASMDSVRDFETGNVVIDAVVGITGKVESTNVLSGPPSLRGAAIEALKQYQYEPATRNGQPVTAHLTVTVRFQFEP